MLCPSALAETVVATSAESHQAFYSMRGCPCSRRTQEKRLSTQQVRWHCATTSHAACCVTRASTSASLRQPSCAGITARPPPSPNRCSTSLVRHDATRSGLGTRVPRDVGGVTGSWDSITVAARGGGGMNTYVLVPACFVLRSLLLCICLGALLAILLVNTESQARKYSNDTDPLQEVDRPRRPHHGEQNRPKLPVTAAWERRLVVHK